MSTLIRYSQDGNEEIDLSPEDREYVVNLPFHLIEANEIDKLKELMQDNDYLAYAKTFKIDWLNHSEVKKALNL